MLQGSARELNDFRIIAAKVTHNIRFREEGLVSYGSEYLSSALCLLVRVQKSVVSHKYPVFLFYTK